MILPSARLAALAVSLAAVPLAGVALEPRYDHRDQEGVLLAVEGWRESVAVSGQPTVAEFWPRLWVGWGFDVSGEGDEIILGGSVRLGDWSDPSGLRYLAGVNARYRGYFGTEELKTFFEVGLWSELKNRFVVGPEVGLGMTYDPNRSWGAFFSAHFGTGFGDARIASLGASAGVQLRFP
jgi:hypothetical protein